MPFFSVTWVIENFSLCAHLVGEALFSPAFTLPELSNNTTWHLKLYPAGSSCSNRNYVSCYIKRNDDQDQSSEISRFNTMITVFTLNSNFQSVTFKSNFIIPPNGSWGHPNLISHEKLYNTENGFLPNDTLTVHLYICPVSDENEEFDAPDMRNILASLLHPNYTIEKCLSKSTDSEDTSVDHCSFLTRVPVERKTLYWTIKELSAKRKSKEKMSVVLDSEFGEGVKLQLVCYVQGSSGNESLRMDVYRKGTYMRQTFCMCVATLLDGSDVPICSSKSEQVFGETYRRWSFPAIEKLSSWEDVMKNGDDSLKLKCDFVISYEPQNVDHFFGKNHPTSNQSSSSNRNKLLEDLLTDETSDFSFECENGKRFPVHRFLIVAKSPVFRAMFKNDTLEKRTGVVRMRDTDSATVRHLRHYLYSDSLPDRLMGTEDVLKLYSVADKYQIGDLRNRCADFLKCNMALDNVFEILKLADLHHDAGVGDYARDFVIAEVDFDSDLWKVFMEENLPVAAETLRKICMRMKAKHESSM